MIIPVRIVTDLSVRGMHPSPPTARKFSAGAADLDPPLRRRDAWQR
jgi:hypothetical protein